MFKSPNLETKRFKNCHGCLCTDCMGEKNLKGQVVPYKNYNIRIPVDILVIGCSKCSNFVLGPGDAKMIDEACEYIIKNHPEHVEKVV